MRDIVAAFYNLAAECHPDSSNAPPLYLPLGSGPTVNVKSTGPCFFFVLSFVPSCRVIVTVAYGIKFRNCTNGVGDVLLIAKAPSLADHTTTLGSCTTSPPPSGL